jgi:conjugative transfer signal peptidase TraF
MRIRTLKPFYIVGLAALSVLAGRLALVAWAPPLVISYTASEPYGVYGLYHHPPAEYRRGMMVQFPVPDPFTDMVYGRQWLAPGVPLLKSVGALAGDRVCVYDDHAEVNDQAVGPVYDRDSDGRPMPRIRGCFAIAEGQFFPLSTYIPRSFDGRYIGPQPLSLVTAEARPLWTF